MRPARPVAFLAACFLAGAARAGPPFLTDDPEPVEHKHFEWYVFSTVDKAKDGTQVQAPAFELNYGFAPNFQAHVVFPFVASAPKDGPDAYGPGDTEFGVKYRFLQETPSCPMAGVFPMLEVPTGDADRGLGNGRTWARLPLWLQKSFGPWTTYGGAGYTINTAPEQRNYFFAGWLVQRKLSDQLTLGGEVFTQGKTEDSGQATTFANLGGYYNFTEHFSLLFSAGHSIADERHPIGYLGLYWTW